jgi:hypothetical protein
MRPTCSNSPIGFVRRRILIRLSCPAYGDMSQDVNWVLDADIRSFFHSVDHEWLLRMVAHRTADSRILQLMALLSLRPVFAAEATHGQWDAARSRKQPAPCEHLPALHPQLLGPPRAPAPCTRSRCDCADDFVGGFEGRCAGKALDPQAAAGRLPPDALRTRRG